MAHLTISAPRMSARLGPAITVAAIAIALVAPAYFYPIFLMKLLCFGLFACAFNLLLGFVGLLSFGHAAFFGGAAYFTAHAAKVWEWSTVESILFGAVAAALMGCVMGFLAIRRQGIYFAMVTLALAQMFFFICLQAPFTHGEDGIQNVPRGTLFGIIDLNNSVNMYYFVLAVFSLSLFALWRAINSPFGQILKSIRENETRAISLGYKVQNYKLAAFVMSAFISGLAGGTKAIVFQFATLTDVSWQMSGEVILMALLGGIGTLIGPLVGAAVIVSLQNFLATSAFPVTIASGLIFMASVLVFRRGIVGELRHLWERKFGGKADLE